MISCAGCTIDKRHGPGTELSAWTRPVTLWWQGGSAGGLPRIRRRSVHATQNVRRRRRWPGGGTRRWRAPIPVRRAAELLDVHPQDLRQAHQDAVAVDAALASLDLGQPSTASAAGPGCPCRASGTRTGRFPRDRARSAPGVPSPPATRPASTRQPGTAAPDQPARLPPRRLTRTSSPRHLRRISAVRLAS